VFSFFLELSVLDLTDMIFFIGADWVNPEDPNVIAETRKLAELKPRARPKVSYT